MSQELVDHLNRFTAEKHPGHVGVSLTRCEADLVIALFRCTQMLLYPKT